MNICISKTQKGDYLWQEQNIRYWLSPTAKKTTPYVTASSAGVMRIPVFSLSQVAVRLKTDSRSSQPNGKLFVFPLKEIIDDGLRTADKAGGRAGEGTGKHVARCHQNIGGKDKEQDRLHVFALKKRRNADANSTENTEDKCQCFHIFLPFRVFS